ncbi:SAV0927 family protein [Sediminibacillus albus]|uniref:DUF3055 domain-containing protein n=1 Tax=Sediminibacillus albus TaxID=407036 RepID=A0A1G8Z003_9BACI|nr:SAV0927 family protein [Sediminibacillus albus]SDK07645.1 Protein of unknown function [Sediminibacillus albus]
MVNERLIIHDDKEEIDTRFISFKGNNYRFDLALAASKRYQGKTMVMDLNGNQFAIINKAEAAEPGILEHYFHYTEMKAEELRMFLLEVLD